MLCIEFERVGEKGIFFIGLCTQYTTRVGPGICEAIFLHEFTKLLFDKISVGGNTNYWCAQFGASSSTERSLPRCYRKCSLTLRVSHCTV